ncbi:anaerobic ribonucleoside-triphosphate reductase activating protein [Allocoprobacillus halotolerans]|uniref:Anaerobic ribonucleoside-triphosphate reductase-activating protein n=1 Tax=Allocoprobacillus halotolerans TaxID=2944914 RepID=A0ABY5HZN9_9FIRM|nr:anaerobic ribonucleoside-triphosphate reductase activating protein [Allocoprobacillus halotolerans]UTY38017.1 anaerobic ribonucleoside-triphosphate reductase activating protein [Allocoprobacillus halotolerans]
MKYATIKTVDIANGTGVRVSLFVSGCTHRCPDCFNEIAWDFQYGQDFTQETIDFILKALSPEHIAGLTLLGGEPMELVNQEGLLPLLRQVRNTYPDKNIWCYTGYLYEDLLPGGRAYGENTDEILSYIDILVDGPFIVSQKNIRLKFRGSENQRIIDIKRTNQACQVVLWDEK